MITIAVLPLAYRGNLEEGAFFSDGITEEIIHALSKIDALRVTSRVSSFYYKGKQLPLQQIAQELNVEVILSGSVQLADNILRVSVQLLDAKEDLQFWSERWDRPLENLFAIQDELSLLIGDKLREQYGHLEISEPLPNRKQHNISAYSLCLKAKQVFNRWNPADCHHAIELFEAALTTDPSLVCSYIGLADAYSFLAITQQMPRAEGWRLATEYTQKGLQLQPEHPGLHYLLANQSFFVRMNFQAAQQHIQQALEYDPSHGESRLFSAFLATISQNWVAAEKQLAEMLKRDPHHPETLFYLAYLKYYKNDFAAAKNELDQLIIQQPNNIPAHITLAYCFLAQNKPATALANLESFADAGAPEVDIIGIRCLANYQNQDNAAAQEDHERLIQLAKRSDDFQAHVYCFLLDIHLQKLDAAFDRLASLIQLHSSIILLFYHSPLTKGIKNDSRYLQYSKRLFGTSTTTKSKPKKKLLSEAVANAHFKRIEDFMKNEQPYLSPMLSLRDLAGQLQLHPNQLSWILNECAQQNFNTYINQFRVDYFKQIAQLAQNQHLSLLGLAFESGFNSKTSFNVAFKQLTGMTPSQFLKAIKVK